MRPRALAMLSALVIVMATTAITGCSPEDVADVDPDARPSETAAEPTPGAVADRGLITVYHEPG